MKTLKLSYSQQKLIASAPGDVVVFLDAHCEVDYNWLPPLLAPIHEDRTTLAVPVIDGINWNDFSITPVYAAGAHSRGLFEWGMLYKVSLKIVFFCIFLW